MIVIAPLWFLTWCFSFLQLGVLIDRRVLIFVLPVFSFILLYSKLPHKVSHVKCEVQQLSSFKHCFWMNHTFGWSRNSGLSSAQFQCWTYLQQLQLTECMWLLFFLFFFFAFICGVDSENNRELELLIAFILSTTRDG